MSFILNCPVNPIYRTSPQQKLESKNAAHKFKYGSPKIRDLLREKCRIRVKEARAASFQGSRKNTEKQTFISKIIKEELADLEEDIKLQELIYEEIAEEANTWFRAEYEDQENYYSDLESRNIVFCPICQRCPLQKLNPNLLECECQARFNFLGSLEEFQVQIQKTISIHAEKCNEMVDFFTEPNIEGNSTKLNVLCDKCDFFTSL